MEVSKVLQWFNNNRELITVNAAEKELGMSRGTLNQAINGTRNLPKKYLEPLTILMDSLTAAPSQKVATNEPPNVERLKDEPPKVATYTDEPVKIVEAVPPMLQHSTKPTKNEPRTETTLSGILVRYRDKYPSFKDKHGGEYHIISTSQRKKSEPIDKIFFNGTCYMKTGGHAPARFTFNIEDLR